MVVPAGLHDASSRDGTKISPHDHFNADCAGTISRSDLWVMNSLLRYLLCVSSACH